jgi:CBS domain containing-hemolysin-like protein
VHRHQTADALASANARIATLEAELNALQRAFDVATTAKASAEKLHKSALAKAKKAEKALADANKEHLQREQAVAEWLNTMSAATGGAHYTLFLFLLLFDLLPCTFSNIFLSCCLSVTLLLQNIPRFRCQLRNPAMILF